MVVKSKYRPHSAGRRIKEQHVTYGCKKMGYRKYEIKLATFASQIHKYCSLKRVRDKLSYGVANRNGSWMSCSNRM